MAQSFYGGLNGKSFSIQTIFSCKQDLDTDVSKGWASPISIGEFVVISYGLPNDVTTYEANRNKDLNSVDKRSYNSTLWQKCYDEDYSDSTTGIYYKLISSMTGNTPSFIVKYVALEAYESPYATIDNTDLDKPVLTIYMPHSYEFVDKNGYKVSDAEFTGEIDTVVLDANRDPKSEIVNMGTEDYPYQLGFKFSIPQSQVIGIGNVKVLDANENPDVTINNNDINNPILTFEIPQAQNIKVSKRNTLDANEEPNVDLDASDINNPNILFDLPQSQILQAGGVDKLTQDELPIVEIDDSNINKPIINFKLPFSKAVSLSANEVMIAPELDPTVEDIGDDTNVVLDFKIPRAAKYYYGEMFGKRLAGQYTENAGEENYYRRALQGDYYINTKTGFVYLITNVDGANVTVEYQGCLQAPIPDTEIEGINPYTLNEDGKTYSLTKPTVNIDYSDEAEQTGWVMSLGIPSAPELKPGNIEIIGIDDAASAQAIFRQDATGYTIDWTIPAGSKIYSNPMKPAEALNGDIWIDDTGKIWQYDETGWYDTTVNIRGEKGDALNLTGTTLTYDDVGRDNTSEWAQKVGARIEEDLKRFPATNEIVPIGIVDDEGTIYYWFFYDGQSWDFVQLTGSVDSFLAIEKTDDTNEQAYTVSYINSLLSDSKITENLAYKGYTANYVNNLLSSDKLEDTVDKGYTASYINSLESTLTSADSTNSQNYTNLNIKVDNLLISSWSEAKADLNKGYKVSYINTLKTAIDTNKDNISTNAENIKLAQEQLDNLIVTSREDGNIHVYGTGYINNLIVEATPKDEDKSYKTYSTAYIDAKFKAMQDTIDELKTAATVGKISDIKS